MGDEEEEEDDDDDDDDDDEEKEEEMNRDEANKIDLGQDLKAWTGAKGGVEKEKSSQCLLTMGCSNTAGANKLLVSALGTPILRLECMQRFICL